MLKVLRSWIRVKMIEREVKKIARELKKMKAKTWKRYFESGGLVR